MIAPAKWRSFFKPAYHALFAKVKAAGRDVWYHSDGNILEIIPDLIEAGVEVVNPQVGANGLEELRRVCQGKICVDLDLDRQMFPFWKPADIHAHVREAVETLGSPAGGLFFFAPIEAGLPLANIEAIVRPSES